MPEAVLFTLLVLIAAAFLELVVAISEVVADTSVMN
jgi:hypothetical protein